MKRALFLLLAVSVVVVLTGCCHNNVCGGANGGGMTGLIRGSCSNCPDVCQRSGPGCRGGRGSDEVFDPGLPTGAVTYPYYTVRGPRDFLAQDPRPIGP